jgi:uncharacterized membrane protein
MTTAIARPAPSRPAARKAKGPGVGWWLVVAGATVVVLYGIAYVVLGDRMYPPPLVDSFRARPWGIYPHAFFGAIALAVGPFQFRRDALVKRRALHRLLGEVYVVSALLTGLVGLYMASYSYGGLDTHLGFGLLALSFLVATTRAYVLVRQRRFVEHREWMIRSYAIIFGAVLLRLQAPIVGALTPDFDTGYAILAWSSWVPNLIWAEWYVRRSAARERPRVQEIAMLSGAEARPGR